MGIARIANFCGYIPDTEPVDILLAIPRDVAIAKRVVKLLTLFNPNVVDHTFTLQYTWQGPLGDEQTCRRFRDIIPLTDSWVFGSLGGIMILDLTPDGKPKTIKVVLDAAPTIPIEYGVDFADAV